MFNGIVYYSNIVWIFRSILFPPEADPTYQAFSFFKTCIAWLNLDFGIEVCFYQGMDAYGKTWLQFVFPIYLWVISGTIIVCCCYSSWLTKILGNKAVPVLATLFYLSYVKLMRTIIDSLSFRKRTQTIPLWWSGLLTVIFTMVNSPTLYSSWLSYFSLDPIHCCTDIHTVV